MAGIQETAARLMRVCARNWLLLALLAALALVWIASGFSSGGAPSDMEARMERVLGQVEGAGRVRVMVLQGDDGAAGVLVVAEGARDVGVRLTLQSAVCTLLGIANERIVVIPMEGDSNGP